jgi:hypothetical protein
LDTAVELVSTPAANSISVGLPITATRAPGLSIPVGPGLLTTSWSRLMDTIDAPILARMFDVARI